MLIKSVEFIGAIGQPGQAMPEAAMRVPQIAFSGRSNVGKSSLINRLLGRTRTPMARVSGQPGKTQEINFYEVRADAGSFVLTDLPGYGYARAPRALREGWRPLIHTHLSGTAELAGVVQLIDIRHGPTRDDRGAIDYLAELELPVLFVLTKADKLKDREVETAVAGFRDDIGVDAAQILAFSARTGDGRDDLLHGLSLLLQTESLREGMA